MIHTPHFRNGLNLTKSGLEENNRILIKETQAFVDALGVDTIIVHPGIAGDIQAYFDNVGYDILLRKVAEMVNDDHIMRLLKLIID